FSRDWSSDVCSSDLLMAKFFRFYFNYADQPRSFGMFGMMPLLTSSSIPSKTLMRSARIIGTQRLISDSLYLAAIRRMVPLSPEGGDDVPNTAGMFGRSTDFRSSTVSSCCGGRSHVYPSCSSLVRRFIG